MHPVCGYMHVIHIFTYQSASQTHFTTGTVVFVPHRFLTDRTEPSFSPQYYTMMGKTESDDKSNIYENLDAPVPPQEQKQLSYPGSPSQSLAIQGQHQKSGVTSLEFSPVMQARKQYSRQLTYSNWQKHSLLQEIPQGIDG